MRINRTSPEAPFEVEVPSESAPARGERGPAVRRAQELLLHAGFALPRYGPDGDFGAETAAALAKFQRRERLSPSGRFDDATLRALEAAPAPSPDYDALFSDGVVRGVLAVGFDETAAHEPEIRAVHDGLEARGYRPVTADARARLGLDDAGRYVTLTTTRGEIVLELIDAQTPHAKERFAAALRRDELVLYGGHGRYGSGPDFDDLRSPAGNFVIGAPFEPGHVTLGPNDLRAAPLTSGYQLMFFDGCNTFRYLDDLRAVKPAATLDVLGSTTELYWHVTARNMLSLLDGVTRGDDVEQIKDTLDEVNRAGPDDQRRYFVADGFEDNVRPR